MTLRMKQHLLDEVLVQQVNGLLTVWQCWEGLASLRSGVEPVVQASPLWEQSRTPFVSLRDRHLLLLVSLSGRAFILPVNILVGLFAVTSHFFFL